MDELPELPFEQVLSSLSLEDRLKARTVSRAWRSRFDRYPVNTLCYSSRSSDFIRGNRRWVSGAFAKNFISSTRFATFFDTFAQTILSSLRHLRLCDIDLSKEDPTAFARTLNSFRQLEQLDIIETGLNEHDGCPLPELNLNLPMLTSLQLEDVRGIPGLILDAPRLKKIKILVCPRLRLEIVHNESVKRLLVDRFKYMEVKNLKNLQYLYVKHLQRIDPTFVSNLQQLKEIHTNDPNDVSKLFEQKQRLGRVDLKIYLCGLLLNGPDDPARNALGDSSFEFLRGEWLVYLAGNRTRLADEIPFYLFLYYSGIEDVAPGLEADIVKRFTDLNQIAVNQPVRNIERFLDLLKNRENIFDLLFGFDHQRQDLFDRLPEQCAVQKLYIKDPPSDLDFLFRLKHLIHLTVCWSIDRETIRRTFEELPVLVYFVFIYGQKRASILIGHSKEIQVSVSGYKKTVSDLNAAIEFIAKTRD